MNRKLGTSFRLSVVARWLLGKLAIKLGLSQAGVLEMLIREKAEKEGIKYERESADNK